MKIADLARRRSRFLFALTLLAWWPIAAFAQPAPDDEDPLAQHVFSPELVMAHQATLGLSEDQLQSLIREVQELQSDIVPLQFELSQRAEELAEVLAAPRIDEARALDLADAVTGIEARVKKRHLTLLVRIKNLLSEEQQIRLRALRDA